MVWAVRCANLTEVLASRNENEASRHHKGSAWLHLVRPLSSLGVQLR